MTNELRDRDRGIWVVTTVSATYRVDLQARTLCRQPNSSTSASTYPPAALRRDTDTLVLWHLAMCAVGKPMIALVQVRDDAVPTMRTTTPVQAITPAGRQDSPLDAPDWLPVQPGTLIDASFTRTSSGSRSMARSCASTTK